MFPGGKKEKSQIKSKNRGMWEIVEAKEKKKVREREENWADAVQVWRGSTSYL